MDIRCATVLSLALLFTPVAGDSIVRLDGDPIEDVSIVEASYEEVVYKLRGIGVRQRIPGAEVRELMLEGAPELDDMLARWKRHCCLCEPWMVVQSAQGRKTGSRRRLAEKQPPAPASARPERRVR